MAVFIGLLRGINVGKKMMKMADLKEVFEAAGLTGVRTYLQSGNVLGEGKAADEESMVSQLEERIEKRFGFKAEVLLRKVNEIEQILAGNPFLQRERVDTSKLHVTFLAGLPAAAALDKLKPINSDADEFRVIGQEVYIYCPNGYGKTKLSNSFFEKKLGVTATTRNWKTVNMLLETALEMKH